MGKYERRHDLDWLRIGAVLLLVPYHTGMAFNTWGWHIKNADQSQLITAFTAFLHIWHMPLFFLLAGAAAAYALRFRSGGQFLRERFLRLFIPLVFGMTVIVPPQIYCERLFRDQFHGSFFAFYPSVFTTGPYPDGNMSWHHLWFLAYLFAFSAVLLPLLLRWMKGPAAERLSRAGNWLASGSRLYLAAVPLIIVQLTLRAAHPDGIQTLVGDWANDAFYGLIFLYGFWMGRAESLLTAAERLRRGALAAAAVLTVVLMMFEFAGAPPALNNQAGYLAGLGLEGLNTWLWLLALLGFGRVYLNRTTPWMPYAVEAAFPFYIIHQTVIVALAFWIVPLPWSIAVKFLAVFVLAFPGTLGVYEILKRFPVTRFLLGMKTKPSGASSNHAAQS
ncbi:MAG: acyltransferase family protein [Solirubrobacterales bacterium]